MKLAGIVIDVVVGVVVLLAQIVFCIISQLVIVVAKDLLFHVNSRPRYSSLGGTNVLHEEWISLVDVDSVGTAISQPSRESFRFPLRRLPQSQKGF